MSRLTMHERSDKIKWIISFTLIFLAFVIIAGICWYLFVPQKVVEKDNNEDKNTNTAMATIGQNNLSATTLSTTYTIHFEPNGGSGLMYDVYIGYGQQIQLPQNKFFYEGYMFAGWSTTPEGDVVYADRAYVCNLTDVDGGIVTLYAVWGTPQIVTFIKDSKVFSRVEIATKTNLASIINKDFLANVNNLSSGISVSNIIDYGDYQTYDDVSKWYESTSYTDGSIWIQRSEDILSWDIAEDGRSIQLKLLGGYKTPDLPSTNVYSCYFGLASNLDDLKFYSGAGVPEDFVVGADYLYTFTSGSEQTIDVDLSVFGTDKDIYVFYGYISGTVSTSNKICLAGKIKTISSSLPEPPTKTGYTFTGWYTDAECTQLYDDKYVTGDITLYAGWRANQYKIHFDANGGIETMEDVLVTYDKDFKLPTNNFVKQGYKFVGWSSTPDGEVEIPDGWSVRNLTSQDGATYTLYAVWEQAEFVVTFIVDGKTYAQVLVPSGTNLADIINGNINGIFFFVPSTEHLPYDVVEDMSIELQKTKLGEIITHPWALYIGIGIGVVILLGVVILIITKVKK